MIQGSRGRFSEAKAHEAVVATVRQSHNLFYWNPPQPRPGLNQGGLVSTMDFEAYGVVMQAKVTTQWRLFPQVPEAPAPPKTKVRQLKLPAILSSSRIKPWLSSHEHGDGSTDALLPQPPEGDSEPRLSPKPGSAVLKQSNDTGPFIVLTMELVSSRIWAPAFANSHMQGTKLGSRG